MHSSKYTSADVFSKNHFGFLRLFLRTTQDGCNMICVEIGNCFSSRKVRYHLYRNDIYKEVFWWCFQGVYREACNFIRRETSTQVFSCEFWEIFKNTFITEDIRTTAFECILKKSQILKLNDLWETWECTYLKRKYLNRKR